MTTPVASPADPPAPPPSPPDAALSPRLPTFPHWAALLPWAMLWLAEMPYAVWLWGFGLSRLGIVGYLALLGLYLGIGVVWAALGWMIGKMGVTRTLPTGTWPFLWGAIGAWGIVGIAPGIDGWIFQDRVATPITGVVSTVLGALLGFAIARPFIASITRVGRDGSVPNPVTILLGLALFVGLFAAGRIAGNINPPRPGETNPANVLLVTMDTVNIERVSAYGYDQPTTPTLTRLATEGVKFTQAYAHVPLTGPSHATIFTGLQPQALGVYENMRPMPERAVTLAESFRGAGYFTAGIPATKMMRELHGFHQGFDRYPERSAEDGIQSLQWVRVLALRYLKQVWGLQVDCSRIIDDAQYSNRHALAAVDYAAHRPWFMWVHYYDPHAPYHAEHGDYLQQTETQGFNAASLGTVTGLMNLSYQSLQDLLGACYLKENGFKPTIAAASEIEDLKRTYDAQLHYTDRHLGALLEGLKSRGQLENTLVVVTADHGEALYDRGYFGHNFFLHQDEVHVPLIVWWPGKIPNKVIAAPIGLVDLAPTILTLLDIPQPMQWTETKEAWRGVDRSEWLTATPPAVGDPVYLQQFPFSRAVVTPQGEKLIFQATQGQTEHAANPWEGPMWELYHHSWDPQERWNLTGPPPPLWESNPEGMFHMLTRTQGVLDSLARDIDGAPVNDINYAGYLGLAMSKEQLEALKSLGYLQGSGGGGNPNRSECLQAPTYTDAAISEVREVAVP